MNNLLMRELPLRCTIRLWDTYQVRRLLAAGLVPLAAWGGGFVQQGEGRNKALCPWGFPR